MSKQSELLLLDAIMMARTPNTDPNTFVLTAPAIDMKEWDIAPLKKHLRTPPKYYCPKQSYKKRKRYQ